MAGSRELKVVVLGDSSAARRELGRLDASVDDTGRNVEDAQGRLSKFGPAIAKGAAIGGAGLLALSVRAIDAAAEGQKVAAQTGAVIKSTGGAAKVSAEQVADLAGELSKLSRVEDEAIQAGSNLLLTFTNIRNEAGEGNDVFNQATRTLLDMSVALGTDVSSSAIQLGKALNDPIAGVSALAEVGVTFTEDQKAVIASMVETGDVAGAQKVILAELNREFGGSAEAAGNAVTPLDDLRIKLGELEEAFGGRLLDAMVDFERGIEVISPYIKDFIEDFERGLEVISTFTDDGAAAAFLGGVRDNLESLAEAADLAFTALKRVLSLGGKGVKEVLSGGKGDSAVEKGVKSAIKTLPGIGPLVRGIPGFAEGGTVPGPKGAPLLAVVHGGEEVVSNRQQEASRDRPRFGQSPGSPSIVIAEGAVQIHVSGEPDAFTRAWLEQYTRNLPQRLASEISRIQAWDARGA